MCISITYYPTLLLQRYLHKRHVWAQLKAHIPHEHLSNFTFSKTEYQGLNWIHSNEFELNGKLYDIVKTSPSSDSIVVSCINDETEEIIKGNIEREIDKGLKHSENNHKFKKTFDLQHQPIKTLQIHLALISLPKTLQLTPYSNHYEVMYSLKPSPPPKTS